jgi:hypothetical protein
MDPCETRTSNWKVKQDARVAYQPSIPFIAQ